MALPVRKNHSSPPPPRCPLEAGLALLGGAWACAVVWKLSAGPRRFGELRVDVPGVSKKVLSARLRELVATGAVVRTVKDTSPPSVEYALSELGRDLVPVIDTIRAVGARLSAGGGAAPLVGRGC